MKTFNIKKIDTDILGEYEKERSIIKEYSKHYLFLIVEGYKKKGFSNEKIFEFEKHKGTNEIDEEVIKQYDDFVSRFDNYKI